MFFSCAKEELDCGNLNLIGEPKPVTANATLPKSANVDKTLVDSVGKVKWESTDQIVVNGSTLDITSIAASGTEAVFTGTVGAMIGTNGYWATYPAALSATYPSQTSLNVTLPTTQTYNSGDRLSNYMVAYAVSEDPENISFRFKNLCSIIKIPVKAAPAKSGDAAKLSKIEIISNQNVSGAATVTMDDGGNPSMDLSDGKSKVTLNCGNVDVSSKQTFSIILPAGTQILTVRFYDATGKYMKLTLSGAGSGVVISRNRIYTTGDVELDATSDPGNFSVSPTLRVRFSPGNLQYIGTAATPYWKFADHQWDYIGGSKGTGQFTARQDVDRDLFGYGTSGYEGLNPYECRRAEKYSSQLAAIYHLDDIANTEYDWGVHNAIYNPATGVTDPKNTWRIPTKSEYEYMLDTRRVTVGGVEKLTYFTATVNGKKGLVILPDDWDGSLFTSAMNTTAYGYAANYTNYTFNETSTPKWSEMEASNVAFLPATGGRANSAGNYHDSTSYVGLRGGYWTGTFMSQTGLVATAKSYTLWFSPGADRPVRPTNYISCFVGYAVRLVQDAD